MDKYEIVIDGESKLNGFNTKAEKLRCLLNEADELIQDLLLDCRPLHNSLDSLQVATFWVNQGIMSGAIRN